MENNVPYEELIYRFLIGGMTASEQQQLQCWLDEKPGNRKRLEKIAMELKIAEEGKLFHQLNDEVAWQKLRLALITARAGSRKQWGRRILRYAAVIALPLLAGVAGWMLISREPQTILSAAGSGSITPGSNRALLILSNGEHRVLGEQMKTEVIEGVKTEHNQQFLRYDSVAKVDITWGEMVYNTLKIPYGGEYQVVLTDGTKVWMNAGSELRYPIAFAGNERRVYLSGEAYFEVSHDTSHPFYVITDDVHIRVYGTAFNVNTNRRTEVQTVLVAGSIGIGKNGCPEEILLKPGELAGYDKNSHDLRVVQVNTAQYIAWKDGYFAFENESLEEIMDMLGRWYNVEVFFISDALKSLKFTGYLRKYEDIEKILEAIQEVVEVHFSLQHRTIVVSR